MESSWERSTDLISLSLRDIDELLEESGRRATEAVLLEGGKANTNYRLALDDGMIAVLRLRTREPESASKELALLHRFYDRLPVPKVLSRSNRPVPWCLLQWMPGKTLERLIEEGREGEILTAAEDIGRALATISSVRFDGAGFLDANLAVASPWPSVMSGLYGYFEMCARSIHVDAAIAKSVQQALERQMPDMEKATQAPCLSHADYKASNLLIHEGRLSGILDWEFAHAGTWLLDAGQLFRHREHLPEGFERRFERGLSEVGGEPISGWQRISRAIDLVNLVGFLSESGGKPKRREGATRLILRTLQDLESRGNSGA